MTGHRPSQEIERGPWTMRLDRTQRGGLVLRTVRFQGVTVIASASVPFIYVDYEDENIGAFTDHLDGSRNDVDVRPIVGGVDLHLVYDGAAPDYRYEHLWRFFLDGRFLTRVIAYGPGEEHGGKHAYFVPTRIVPARDHSSRVWSWLGPPSTGLWAHVKTEAQLIPYPDATWPFSFTVGNAGGEAADSTRRVTLRPGRSSATAWALAQNARETAAATGSVQPSAPGSRNSVPEVFNDGQPLADGESVLWLVERMSSSATPAVTGVDFAVDARTSGR
jgi:hypothetical protein